MRASFVLICLFTATALFAEDRFYMSEGLRIRYVDQGTGDAIVLIHGFTGSSDVWTEHTSNMANLSRGHRVIALDLRGHGKSDKPHDPEAYGDKMCLDVVRLMDHVGVSKAHIVGFSLGARVVGYLLATHPDRFITATLVGAAPRVGWPRDDADGAEQDAREMEQRAKSGLDDGQDYVALAAVARSRYRQVVSENEISRIKVPTLGVIGTKDSHLRAMQDLKRIMPTLSRVVLIEGQGHQGTPARPEFLQAFRSFIASHEVRPRR